MIHFFERFRSFDPVNIRSVDQRAAKLLVVKVGVHKKKSADLAITAKVCASVFGPGSSQPRFESFSKFDRL